MGIGGYRCFGDAVQCIAPLERINVLIGPNNVGKSATLRFFEHLLSPALGAVASLGDFALFTDDDVRTVREKQTSPLRVWWPLKDDALGNLPRELVDALFVPELNCPGMKFQSAAPGSRQVEFDSGWLRELDAVGGAYWNTWSMSLTSTGGGRPGDDRDRVLRQVLRNALWAPEVSFIGIPAHRQVAAGGGSEWNFAGSGFIEQLDRIRNPEPGEHELRRQHRELLANVREVLELSVFDYHVSSGTKALILEVDGERRPLASLGTGYEHVIMLIAATIVFPEAFLCVEEPEVHMHPRLQRRLAEYLREKTTNQMLISTHSATLIDALQGATFRLQRDADETTVSRPLGSDLLHGLSELGYRPSDLLQTNCVIWVEGPSDRIYLKWWLSTFGDDFVEGVHYTIMFYGGSLLASASAAAEPDGDDVVPLRRLNQHLVVICDSDRQRAGSPLKARVQRIQNELDEAKNGLVWVTAGRTIENYLDPERLTTAVQEVHPSAASYQAPAGKWDDMLDLAAATTANKVKIAQKLAATEGPDLSRLDLRDRLDELAAFIRQANQ